MIEDLKENIKVFGREIIDQQAIDQLLTCTDEEAYGVLTADAHVGYAHPIGGAVAYRDKISLSGVGFDIACGNLAVRTDVRVSDLDISALMDEITSTISFGIGQINKQKVDHPVLDRVSKIPVKTSPTHRNRLVKKARSQLGTVGSGNHFVDIFEDAKGYTWVGVHFGSRGFGHGVTTGFMALAQGKNFEDRVRESNMFSKPILFNVNSEMGQDYLECLDVAGAYARAGREWVVQRVLKILGNPTVTYEVHNHHNFAWNEEHFGESFWVVRKGCTPSFPGQKGFIGSNMFDHSVVVEGMDNEESRKALFSTVHGAGRVLSRRKATGKFKYSRDKAGMKIRRQVKEGLVDFERTKKRAIQRGIELRGGGADESPECYKKLEEVLGYQGKTIRVLHRLRPIGVAMAGIDVFDPYRD